MAPRTPSSRPASRRAASARRGGSTRKAQTVFTPRNYHLLLGAIALIVLGYVVMRAENEVDGFLSLYVAPVLLLAGYAGVLFAILWRPRAKAEEVRVEEAVE
jgi:hypothetical protein